MISYALKLSLHLYLCWLSLGGNSFYHCLLSFLVIMKNKFFVALIVQIVCHFGQPFTRYHFKNFRGRFQLKQTTSN